MERVTSFKLAKEIMGENFIGPEELASINSDISLNIDVEVPKIFFSEDFLRKSRQDHILVLLVSTFKEGSKISLKELRDRFGLDPHKIKPCFYNQDWYLNEKFIEKSLEPGWYLIRKRIDSNFCGVDPQNIPIFLSSGGNSFPPAVLVAYLFFIWFFLKNEVLWLDEYVWCEDFDDNGDRIYVGRYCDKLSSKRIGFEIHRHLKIKNNYSIISYYSVQ